MIKLVDVLDGQGILWNWQNLPHSFFLFLVVLRLVVACSTPRYGGNEYAVLRLIRNRENPHAQMGRHGSEKPASKVKLCNSRKCRNLRGKNPKSSIENPIEHSNLFPSNYNLLQIWSRSKLYFVPFFVT